MAALHRVSTDGPVPVVVWPELFELADPARTKCVDQIARMLCDERLIVLQHFADHCLLPDLKSEALAGRSFRVTATEREDEVWSEHQIEPGGHLWTAMTSPMTENLIVCALERPIFIRRGWANVYECGEKNGWHRDGEGDLQLVLCLEQPTSGGIFLASLRGCVAEINLRAGDALLFDATRLSHATTRVKATNQRRITSVIRFYALPVPLQE